jgi:DNA sulfur modification protein DndC
MGCWTCTLVKQNRSLENRVDSGEEWLVPLLQFHHHLMEMTDPEKKQLYRSLESRGTHRVELTRQGRPSYRCLTLETRKDLLRRLLMTQEQVRRDGPDPTMELIGFEELCAIREAWRSEGDWEDSLPQIYASITGHDEAWPVYEDELWMNQATKEALLYHCQHNQLPPQLMIELVEAWKQFQRSVAVPDAPDEETHEPKLVPLFEDDLATSCKREAMQRLVEHVADLFYGRDWRGHEERLAEALAHFEAEQEKRHASPTFKPLV